MITISEGPKKSSFHIIFVRLFAVVSVYFGAAYGMEEVLVVDDQRDVQDKVQKQIEDDRAFALQTAVRAMHECKGKHHKDTESADSLSTSPTDTSSVVVCNHDSVVSSSSDPTSGEESDGSISTGSTPGSPNGQTTPQKVLVSSAEEAARKREEDNALLDGECCICMDNFGQKKDLTGVSPDRYKFDKTAVHCVEKVKLHCGHIFCDGCIGGWLREADVKREKDVFFPRWLIATETFRPESISCPMCRGAQPVAKGGEMVLARCAYCLDPLSTAYENATFFDCLVVDYVFADMPLEKICRGPKARRVVCHRFHENCLHEWYGHKDFKWSMREEGLLMLCPCHRYDKAHDLSTDRYGGYIIISRDSPQFEVAKFMVDNPDQVDKSPRERDEEIAEIVRQQDEEMDKIAAQKLKERYDARYGPTPAWFRWIEKKVSQLFGGSDTNT